MKLLSACLIACSMALASQNAQAQQSPSLTGTETPTSIKSTEPVKKAPRPVTESMPRTPPLAAAHLKLHTGTREFQDSIRYRIITVVDIDLAAHKVHWRYADESLVEDGEWQFTERTKFWSDTVMVTPESFAQDKGNFQHVFWAIFCVKHDTLYSIEPFNSIR